MEAPKTLQDAIVFFSNADNCVAFLVAQRWPDGDVVCPTCGRADAQYLPARRVWQCKTRHPKCQFSVKVGTIFEDSPIGLDKWLTAMWMIANCKNGVSSYEIHRALGVTQKTAWFMLHRIRLTMQDDNMSMIGGNGAAIEMDETFIGGKVKNMHKSKKPKPLANRTTRLSGVIGKTIVVGMLERNGRVRAEVVIDRTQAVLHDLIHKHVATGTTLITDEHVGYKGTDFEHEVINHANEYVNGLIHTNGIENFWSLLKRGLNGTYVSVEPFHLFRYIDEQAFRYNNRAKPGNADATFRGLRGRAIHVRPRQGAETQPPPDCYEHIPGAPHETDWRSDVEGDRDVFLRGESDAWVASENGPEVTPELVDWIKTGITWIGEATPDNPLTQNAIGKHVLLTGKVADNVINWVPKLKTIPQTKRRRDCCGKKCECK